MPSFNLSIVIGLLALSLGSCDPNLKENEQNKTDTFAQIVLIMKDSLIRDFLRQRKATLKYLDDASMPVTIDFSGKEDNQVLSINTEREAVELVYRDNSQSRYSYLLAKGDSVEIGLDNRKPWLKTMNKQFYAYDENLDLLRNRELHQSTYAPLQDFYFLWQANFDSPTPIDLKEEIRKARTEARESLESELAWLDSLRSDALVSGQTVAFYSAKAKFENDKLDFFAKEDGFFDQAGALDYYMSSIKDSSEFLKTVYLDEFSEFLLAQLTSEDSYEIIHPDALGTNTGPFGKRMLFKLLQQSLPRLSFQKANKWLGAYETQLENMAQADYLKAQIDNLKGARPDMDLMGIGNRLMSFEELLDQEKGKYLYIDLWAAWCIPCIKSFPALRKLHEKYNHQGIQVIHLSVDRNHKFWEEVVRKHEIAYRDRSFIALNLAESTFLQKLDVAYIPRYLIFDPNGKLIHPNAAGPDTEEIVRFFDTLLPR